jgi:uncharacterized protein YndB with AHSA1/START domain
MSGFQIVNEYAHPIDRVWRALTDPELIPLWTSEGLGGTTEGFQATEGTHFRFVAKPQPFWRGVVECEVIEARPPALLRYTWVGDAGEPPSVVTYELEPRRGATRFTFRHAGFRGVGGFVVSRVLERVRTRMLDVGLRRVLDDLDGSGRWGLGPQTPAEGAGRRSERSG